MPGAMRTCSMPSSTKMGQITSANCAAAMDVPSAGRGATLFATIARPKWPRNMDARCLEAVTRAEIGDHRGGAARRVALHVHGNRIHRDVRRGELDVHG